MKVEPLDAVQVEEGEHGAQGGQQHPVLYLEVLDGLKTEICHRKRNKESNETSFA